MTRSQGTRSQGSTQATQMTDSEVALFQDLLNLNSDGHNGYMTAANALTNAEYAELFRQYAQERQQNATELAELLQRNGQATGKTGTFAGMLHQGWINLESLLTQGDAPIFGECERVDALTLAAYQDVMGKTTKDELMELLRQQFTTIRNAYERVKNLHSALVHAQK